MSDRSKCNQKSHHKTLQWQRASSNRILHVPASRRVMPMQERALAASLVGAYPLEGSDEYHVEGSVE